MLSLFRLLTIFFSVALLPSLIGGSLAGIRGVCGGMAFAAIVLMVLSFLAERIVARWLGVMEVKPAGLTESLEKAVGRPVEQPVVQVFRDAFPKVLVIRGALGGGKIFLSQALLALLDENELRQVLRQSVNRADERGVRVRSLATVLSILMLSINPSSRSEISPLSALSFLLFLPMTRFFLGMSQWEKGYEIGPGATHKALRSFEFGHASPTGFKLF